MSEEPPMRLLKRVMIHETMRFHREGYGRGSITMPIRDDGNYTFRGAIETVQNTFNQNVFSAILHFENYQLTIGNERATVNILIVLPEVSMDYLINPNLVRFNSAEEYHGENLQEFVNMVPNAIAEEWNQVS